MKNFIKKLAITLTLVMTFALCFAFAGCGDDTPKDCSWCKNDPASLSEHSIWRTELSITATCTESGTTTIQCDGCKRTAEIPSKALGHDYKITKDEATCLQDGNTYYACSRKGCNATKTEFSKASPSKHKWVETYSKETIQYTYKDYKCSTCGETKTERTKVDMGSKLKNTEERFYYATGAAVQIVKGKLKYPSSARFIKEQQMEVHYNGSSYFIEGAVSAPNAFGVYTDFYFIVKTKIRVSGSKYTWYDYDCVLEE